MKIFGFCFHDWGRWSDPVNGLLKESSSNSGYFNVCQMRVCKSCGLAQTQKLPNLRSLEHLKEER